VVSVETGPLKSKWWAKKSLLVRKVREELLFKEMGKRGSRKQCGGHEETNRHKRE